VFGDDPDGVGGVAQLMRRDGAAGEMALRVGGAVAIAVFGALIADPDRLVTRLPASLTIAAALLPAAAVSVRIRPSH
jgi:hypothetical protein